MLTEIGFLWWVLDLVGSGAEDKDGDGGLNCGNCDFGWSFVLHPGYCHLIENHKTLDFCCSGLQSRHICLEPEQLSLNGVPSSLGELGNE